MRRSARFSISLMSVLAIVALGVGAAPAAASSDDTRVLVEGAPLVGGTNGMFFDGDNNLYVANVLGRSIAVLDPETGEIVDRLGLADGVVVPDDVTIGADGTLYWTDPALGQVFRRPPGGPTEPLVDVLSYPNANPLTLSDDGGFLFFAQCYGPVNGVFEVNLSTLAVRDIVTGVPGCASNAMDYADGALYGPRPFEARVVRTDVATGLVTDVTTGWTAPIAVKFNSQGDLYAANNIPGEIVRIDLDEPDVANNREVVGERPGIDNMAFDNHDRLFVSNYTDASVVELLPGGEFRTVSPGGIVVPGGLALIDDTIYTVSLSALTGFDARTGEEVSFTGSVFGFGPLPAPTSVAAWDDHLVLMSALFGQLMVWDPETESPGATAQFTGPTDAQPFEGDLVVTDSATGEIIRVSGPDLANPTPIATATTPTGLAGTDDDLYVSDAGTGEVLQIIDDGVLLDTPVTVASGFESPEGLVLRSGGTKLLVVDGGAQTLEEIDLGSGEVRTIATDLGFLTPLPPVFPVGFFNDVEVDDDAIYVNSDQANVILEIDDDDDDGDDAESSVAVESEADLDGGQEAPAVMTDMTGEVEVEIDDGELEFELEVDDNSHDIFAVHIHCAPPGVNGPVGVTLFVGSFTGDGTVAEGTITAPDAGNGCGWTSISDVAAAIAAGDAYVNVHTTAESGGVPSGEIRGNLGGDLEVESEADLDGGQEAPAVMTDMTGEVEVEIDDGELEFELEVDDNSHDIFAVHIHCAPPGVNGPVGVTLFTGSFTAEDGTVAEGTLTAPDPGNGCGWADLADAAVAIASGNTYVNVHTTAASGGVPSGEIRGNLSAGR